GAEIVGTALPPRLNNSHKGDYGSVGIIGGAAGMTGAALLAARAALKLGTGRVYVGLLDTPAAPYDTQQLELMLRSVSDVLNLRHLNCLAVGPGLGQSLDALHILVNALSLPLPLVLDADALNLLAAYPDLLVLLAQRMAATILTPHPA